MKDRITIDELEVFYCVGVPDAERSRPQRLLLTLVMERDVTAAAASDDLNMTIDYSAVARCLVAFGTGRQWRLIEKVAVDVAQRVLSEFAADRVEVEVKKFILPEARHVSIRVMREKG